MKNPNIDAISFDEEEQEILDAYNSGKLESNPVGNHLLLAPQETVKKNKNINIRIAENDLISIKLIPYQTLGVFCTNIPRGG